MVQRRYRIYTLEEENSIRQNWLRSFILFICLFYIRFIVENIFFIDNKSLMFKFGMLVASTALFLPYYFGYIKRGFYFLTFMILISVSNISKDFFNDISKKKELFYEFGFSNTYLNITTILYICSLFIVILYLINCFFLCHLNFSKKKLAKEIVV